jgi:hypothetical protein
MGFATGSTFCFIYVIWELFGFVIARFATARTPRCFFRCPPLLSFSLMSAMDSRKMDHRHGVALCGLVTLFLLPFLPHDPSFRAFVDFLEGSYLFRRAHKKRRLICGG